MNDFILSVPGQRKALQHLFQLYKTKRVPHALLFTGLRGIGKHFAAVEFTKLLNTTDESSNEVINKKISKLLVPYIKLIHPLPRGKGEKNDSNPYEKLTTDQIENIRTEINKKTVNPFYQLQIDRAFNIKINSINEIRRYVSFNYDESNLGIILLLDAHLMNYESQNALLKTLEEPPQGFVFILITDQKSLLLPTVISRCWEIEFAPLPNQVLMKILIDKFNVTENQAELLSNFAQGSIANASELMDLDLENLLDKVITILRYSLAQRYFTALSSFQQVINDYGNTYFLLTLKLILHWLRDVQASKIQTENVYFNKHMDTLIKFNNRFRDVDIHDIFLKIDTLLLNTKKQVSLNLILLNTIFELSSVGIR
jgi:DNA polymerase-3 subunit delta'